MLRSFAMTSPSSRRSRWLVAVCLGIVMTGLSGCGSSQTSSVTDSADAAAIADFKAEMKRQAVEMAPPPGN
ncbi:hypothetical protein NHH03_02145 [Stieleria sp. TO1_6]|uniref:hypothetical protein n=1 Tax=Stieleria tagensis TaxID=2956795 RepID=UPI00209B2F7C|nr:hypothetical protein [Stieleria tagensis]MCO8120523.1 hypothetical protein [Stieleria tagensis]